MEVLPGNMLDIPSLDRAMQGVDVLFAATFSDHDGTEVRQSDIRNQGRPGDRKANPQAAEKAFSCWV